MRPELLKIKKADFEDKILSKLNKADKALFESNYVFNGDENVYNLKEGLNEADQWRWEMAGLLHDADWDQWPEQHCKKIIEELETRNIDPEIIRAIASHGPNHFGVEPVTKMDKMLFAFDELSGLTHAYSLMRPEGYEGMELKGMKKRFKEARFAANVNRDEIMDAMQRAGVELETVMQFIIERQGEVSKK